MASMSRLPTWSTAIHHGLQPERSIVSGFGDSMYVYIYIYIRIHGYLGDCGSAR